MPKKKMSRKQLEEYILKLMMYRDEELQPYIEQLQSNLKTAAGSNPPTPPPPPPILK